MTTNACSSPDTAAATRPHETLTIRLVDTLEVRRGDEVLPLPSSRKTRALLAYLALSAGSHRRERLCELFWEIPDDPRGALRWSLSKLRRVLDEPARKRLLADRERVSLVLDDVGLDVRAIEARLERPDLGHAALVALATELQRPFLAGLDLPRQPLFQRWLEAERQAHAGRLARAAERLADDPRSSAIESLRWARVRFATRPHDAGAGHALLGRLRENGEDAEAASLGQELAERFDAENVIEPPHAPGIVPSALAPGGVTGAAAETVAARERSSSRVETNRRPHAAARGRIASLERPRRARQRLRFCRTGDGTRIAHGCLGDGSPLVLAGGWPGHLELDRDVPARTPLVDELARERTLVRHDGRGFGLSDRDVDDFSLATRVADLGCVVDALALERFALLGVSHGAAVAVDYAARHPERVSHLVLLAPRAVGWRRDGSEEASVRRREAIVTLAECEWARENPAVRHLFSTALMPNASAVALAWFDEYQRRASSARNAALFLSEVGDDDVRERLETLSVPTLVAHALEDQYCPVAHGRAIAASVPGAHFVGLEGEDHLLLGDEPAAATFVEAMRDFLGGVR